jgi:DNA-binding NarL/FixJ family response regulator
MTRSIFCSPTSSTCLCHIPKLPFQPWSAAALLPLSSAANTTFNETDRLIKDLNPDVVIMDIHMPGEHTAISNEFISRLRCSKLLAISIWGDEPTRMLAEVLGASILLDKANLHATLIPTVTELCQKPV